MKKTCNCITENKKMVFHHTENKCVSYFRDDDSVFDGLMEEDEKDKAKR